ncbi:hypothetical protein LSM04_009361 [Trypanosoma melophagium]|uniref:uncharacterized protein n=1 Tax=Trypanosoma melophagium TaxID=715481 RepID=UPI00351A0A55|nr:hypothetical protein LSM04_009361 [Trypanosoma melophagium]
MATLLGTETAAQLAKIHRVAKALSEASIASRAFYSLDSGKLRISDQSPHDTLTVLVDLGNKLATSAEMLANAVETQLAEFFNYMRSKEAASIVGLLEKRSIVPLDFKLVSKDERPSYTHSPAATLQSTFGTTTGSKMPQNAPLALRRYDQRGAATTLQTCLYVMMESVLTRINASRAAVYLGNDTERPSVLRRVADIHGDENLPTEVSYANTSTLITVVQDSLAVNFDTTQTPNSTHVKKPRRRPYEGSIRHPLHVRSGVVLPIGNYGCVIVADKPVGVPQTFTPFDEHHVWALATLCEGIFARYPRNLLVEMSWCPSLKLLQQSSIMPSIAISEKEEKSAVTGSMLETSVPLLESLPSVPKKLTMLRVRGEKIGIIKDMKGLPRTHLTHDGLFQEAGAYIRNIEMLWKESLREVNNLRLAVHKCIGEIEEKKSKITTLEAEVRRLNTHTAASRTSTNYT